VALELSDWMWRRETSSALAHLRPSLWSFRATELAALMAQEPEGAEITRTPPMKPAKFNLAGPAPDKRANRTLALRWLLIRGIPTTHLRT
jgi:hypothetical protein